MYLRKRAALLGLATVNALMAGILAAPPATAQLPVLVPCSVPQLRAAITTANDAGGGDLLLSPGCVYTLDAPDPDIPTNGLPIIEADIGIQGAGATITRGASASDFRIFEVAEGGALSLATLTVSGGSSIGDGGGILNAGTLELDATAVLDSHADAQGGGVANYATMTVGLASRINGNSAFGAGGGIASSGTLTVRASSIDDNSVTGANGQGGGLFNGGGAVLVEASSIGSNSATADGASGGGLATIGGSVDLQLGFVENNRADTAPGGIRKDGGLLSLTLEVVFNNTPTNCQGSPSPVPGCPN